MFSKIDSNPGWVVHIYEVGEKKNWLARTKKNWLVMNPCSETYVMHQRKRDCIHAGWLVTPTDQVHLWSVIL